MRLRRTLTGLCVVLCPTALVLANASPGAAGAPAAAVAAGAPAAATAAGAAVAVGAAVAPAGAVAVAQGVEVQITEVPDQFAAGASPETMTVVATKRDGGDCLKVRWSMVMRVEGMRLDQVRVDRVEQDGSFPLDVKSDGDSARLTDIQLDPGTLCRDRTVTARYEINFAKDVTDGRARFTVEAYDAELRLLDSDSVTRRVVGGEAPEPTESPTPPPEETEPADPGADVGDAPAPDDPAQQASSTPAGNQIPLPPIGFIIGALMLFLGFGLLFQLYRRRRRRSVRPVTAMPVTAVLPGAAGPRTGGPFPRPPEWNPPEWHPRRSRRRAFR